MLIVDAHEDLAYNMLTFGRDYTRSAAETRRLEAGGLAPQTNGDTLLGWPDYQRGRVACVFSTLFVAPEREKSAWETQIYTTSEQAHKLYRGQLDAYRRLTEEHPDKFRLIEKKTDLEQVLAAWQGADGGAYSLEQPGGDEAESGESSPKAGRPVGLVVLMEGAEGVRSVGELEEWWAGGVRLIGPAWAGNRFCGGTRQPGPLTSEGFELLEGMAALGFVLDLSHMDEQAVLQALDFYPRTVIASHANAAALLPGTDSNRFLSERVIAGLLERGGIIGLVPYNRFLKWGWSAQDGRSAVPLDLLVAQIDHICQIAGDARHAGLGSDFDGGFGLQAAPEGIDTIADLQKLIPLLGERGYTDEDIAAILGGNWINLLKSTLPEAA